MHDNVSSMNLVLDRLILNTVLFAVKYEEEEGSNQLKPYWYQELSYTQVQFYYDLNFKILFFANCFLLLTILSVLFVHYDYLFGIVVSMSDCRPRGPRFDSQLYPRNFSRSIVSGTGSIQPCEDNWVTA